MSIYAIADLHLAFGIPDKSMEYFGGAWIHYTQKIEAEWKKTIAQGDLVLIAGDISWAKNLAGALIDLEWIDKLPGTKVLLRGNHDSWWSSLSQVKKMLPKSIHVIQNDVFNWNGVWIGGSRLWDTDEYSYENYIEYTENPRVKTLQEPENPEEQERIFIRELGRLEMSLACLPKYAAVKIAMTHYPPVGPQMLPSKTSLLLEKHGINIAIFGHLHNAKREMPMLGEARGIKYYLTAADYLEFKPLKIL
jgi:uncharacterized protein